MNNVAILTTSTDVSNNLITRLSDIVKISTVNLRNIELIKNIDLIILDHEYYSHVKKLNINIPFVIFSKDTYFKSMNISPVTDPNFLGYTDINGDLLELKKYIKQILKHVNTKLKKGLETFNVDFFYSNFDGVIIWDREGQIIELNDTAVEKLGSKRESIIGKTLNSNNWQLYNENGVLINKTTFITDMVKNKSKLANIILGLSINGNEIRWIKTNVNLIKGVNGEINYIYTTFTDVTDDKIKTETMKLLSLAIKYSPLSIMIVDTERKIKSVNPKFIEVSGYSEEELIGKKANLFKSKDSKTNYKELWDTVTRGEVWRGEFQNIKKDGSLYTEFATIAPLLDHNNKISYFIAIKEDITILKSTENKLQNALDSMEIILESKKTDLKKAQELTLESLAVLAEYRDNDTGEHIHRTKHYVRFILEKLNYKLNFSKEHITQISNSSSLHDIGKVAIPDEILLKKSKLTCEEFKIMKTHAQLGYEALNRSIQDVSDQKYLKYAGEVTLYHHEKWDGTGYPFNLKGSEIPLSARIMAISDVYDALRSIRPYKKAYSHKKTVNIIKKESGKHFDPELVELFLKHNKEFDRIFSESEDFAKVSRELFL